MLRARPTEGRNSHERARDDHLAQGGAEGGGELRSDGPGCIRVRDRWGPKVTTSPKGVLEPIRDRVRRLQLIVGIGFVALILGSVTTAALSAKIVPRLDGLESGWARWVISLLIAGVWAYAVLPLLCYGAARILELRPLSTAVGAGVTGELFSLGIFFVTGALGSDEEPLRLLVPRFGVLAVGIALSAWAVRRGRADAEDTERAARAAAAQKKDEYAEFTREAERIAARHEAGPAAPSGEAAAAPGEASAASGSAAPGDRTSDVGGRGATAPPPAPAPVAAAADGAPASNAPADAPPTQHAGTSTPPGDRRD